MVQLSLILPAYNAATLLEKHLPVVLAHLANLPLTSEILVVDDGSNDAGATKRIAEKFKVKYIALPANAGKGAAVRAGMLAATGDVRLFTDADVPYELSSLAEFYEQIAHNGFHLAIGDRTLPESDYFQNIPLIRRLSSRVFSLTVALLLLGSNFDTQCGIKAFRADVAEDLFKVSRIDHFALDVELLYIARLRSYRIKKLPVQLRIWEETGLSVLNDGFTMLRDILSIRGNKVRGYYQPETSTAVRN